MSELFHECGVAAVAHMSDGPVSNLAPVPGDPLSVSRLIPRMLLDMQNRGQLAAGMTSYRPDRQSLLETHKDLGTVGEAFRLNNQSKFDAIMQQLDGPTAIGHVRYATCGLDNKSYAQPFERQHGRKTKWFAVAFNGQLTNYAQLRAELLEKGDYHLKRDTDTEILMHELSHQLQSQGKPTDWVEVFGAMAEKFDGAYNVVVLTAAGELIVARDPLGIRPLCYAFDGSLFAAASESVPLNNVGFKDVRSLPPGTLAMMRPGGKLEIVQFASRRQTAHCFFEWIYFANVASTLDDRSVYLARAALGRELAALEDVPRKGTIVVPVPDTAKAAADAMAYELGLPSVEGLMRNRYLGRTFIQSTADRAERARLKYTPLPEVLEGKRVLLVEDSIVRSTTMRALVREIRERGGAREIHLRVACPPIIAPCFYGIDMSSRRELIAPQFADQPDGTLSAAAQQRLADELGADSLRYLPLEALTRSIGLPEDRLCRACVTGRYPTLCGHELDMSDRRRMAQTAGANGNGPNAIKPGSRTYELGVAT